MICLLILPSILTTSMLVPEIQASASLSFAWKNDTTFGIENSHLKFVGDYKHYAYPTPISGTGYEKVSSFYHGLNVDAALSPRITSVTFDKWSVTPGEWVTITVKAKNEGDVAAGVMTIHIGLPTNPSESDVEILPSDMSSYARYYPAGSKLCAGYGERYITSKYAIVEVDYPNWPPGYEGTLSVKVRLPEEDNFVFDVKSITQNGNFLDWYPKSGMIDQQAEYVLSYILLRKFTVTKSEQEIAIPIKNDERYPYKNTQPTVTVETFKVDDYGGFIGDVEATNLPLTINPGETGNLNVHVKSSMTTLQGEYVITYSVSGTTQSLSYPSPSEDVKGYGQILILSGLRTKPTVTLTPGNQLGVAGSTLTYTVSITNNDPMDLGPSTFSLIYSVPSGWSASLSKTSVTLNPGETDSSIILSVTSPATASVGEYVISVTATNVEASSRQGTGYALHRITENVGEARKTLYENYAKLLNNKFWEEYSFAVLKMFKEDFMNSFTNPLAILKKIGASVAIGDYSNAELVAKELGGLISDIKYSDVSFTIDWAYHRAQADPIVLGFYGQHQVNASQEMLDILSLIQQNRYDEAKVKIRKLIYYLQVADSNVAGAPTFSPMTKQSVKDLFESTLNFLHGELHCLLNEETSIKLVESEHKLYLHVYDTQGNHVGVDQTGKIEIKIEGATYIDIGKEIEIILPTLVINFTYKVDATHATQEKEQYNITIITFKDGKIASTLVNQQSIGKNEVQEFSVRILEDKKVEVIPIQTGSKIWPLFLVGVVILAISLISFLILRKRLSSTLTNKT